MRKRIPGTMKFGIVIFTIFVITAAVSAQSEPPQRSLAGVWEVATTPRNCTTGDPIPAAAFQIIYTFHKDGTVTASVPTGTPLPFHGLWRHELGWSDYSFRQIRFLRTPTMAFAGKQEMGGTLQLSESGDEYTSDEYMIVYDINGVPGTPACINSVATRFKLEA